MQEQKFFSTRSVWIVFITTLLCVVAATLATPNLIDWYASPFLPQGAQGASCAPTIQWALNKLLWMQGLSVIVGFVVGSLFAIKFRKKSAAKL